MIEYKDDCVGCPPEMGCRGSGCPLSNVPHWYCDDCQEEFPPSELRRYDGDMLCRCCLMERAWDNAESVED